MLTSKPGRRNRINHLTLQTLCHVVLLGAILLGLLSGCSRRYNEVPAYVPFSWEEQPNYGVGRFKTSFLVEQIDNYYRGTHPGPIGVTTFVNLDDLYSTSSFGRMYSEQVMSELAMRGFDVVELRHSDALQFLASEGEFALSRDTTAVRNSRDLGAVVVGTYVVSPVKVYVNARLLDPSNSMVLSAGSVEMDKTQEIAKMLRGGVFPASLERIPVKHLGFASYPINVFAPPGRWQAEDEGPAGAAPGFYGGRANTPKWPQESGVPRLVPEEGK